MRFAGANIPTLLWACLLIPPVLGFVHNPRRKLQTQSTTTSWMSVNVNGDGDDDETVSQRTTQGNFLDPEVVALKEELIELANKTQKGFRATSSEKRKAKDIINDLAKSNPSSEPAAPFYPDNKQITNDDEANPSLAGKWNLIYTDAPDITGLDSSRNPFATAKLGRIGQECNPPYIKNVIEWRRPDWAKDLPLSGSDDSRVLQKVVTSASARPEKPLNVDLKVAGLELESGDLGSSNNIDDDNSPGGLLGMISNRGLPAGLLSSRPIDLKGPLNPPFGRFEILYLDDDIRIVLTGQNYVAVNRRIKDGEEWF